MLAGMAGVSGPNLVAAVSNAGGIGTLGAIGMNPEQLRDCIRSTRALTSKPIGVDLLLPKVGGNARATNKDYTGGQLNGLVSVMLEEKVELFVCAVGLPPRWVVDKLHANGTVVMNMIGSPKHVKGCIRSGVDIVCAQGTEAGAHTGAISTMVLVPQVVDLLKGTGILTVGAGGIYDGRGVAACFALGAEGVWLGSRFIVSPEANVPKYYKQAILESTSDDTVQTEIYTGRPVRALRNGYIKEWEGVRVSEKRTLLKKGIVPFIHDAKSGRFGKSVASPIPGGGFKDVRDRPGQDNGVNAVAVGQLCGALTKIEPAKDIVDGIMKVLDRTIETMRGLGLSSSRL